MSFVGRAGLLQRGDDRGTLAVVLVHRLLDRRRDRLHADVEGETVGRDA